MSYAKAERIFNRDAKEFRLQIQPIKTIQKLVHIMFPQYFSFLTASYDGNCSDSPATPHIWTMT